MVSLANYPASLWTATLYLINSSNKITKVGTNDGGDHKFTFATTDITNSKSGDYQWQIQVNDADETYTVGSGMVTVRKNFATATATDLRTTAKKMVDALEEALIGSASQTVLETEIQTSAGSRKVKHMTATERLQWYNYWLAKIQAEERADRINNGLKPGGKFLVRFS